MKKIIFYVFLIFSFNCNADFTWFQYLLKGKAYINNNILIKSPFTITDKFGIHTVITDREGNYAVLLKSHYDCASTYKPSDSIDTIYIQANYKDLIDSIQIIKPQNSKEKNLNIYF